MLELFKGTVLGMCPVLVSAMNKAETDLRYAQKTCFPNGMDICSIVHLNA